MSTSLRINPTRLQSDFSALSAIGATAQGGVNRPALSPAHLEARAWFAAQVHRAGLALQIDGAGNHSAILRCPNSSAQTLLLGSHLDSVPDGGRYDGALGVTAALEVLRTMQEAGLRLPVHLEAIDFTDEEGTLVGFIGSGALAGTLTPGDLQNPRGGRQAVLGGLARAGLNEAGLFTARRDPATLAGYLELHIEQGPRLYDSGVDIGVVSGIVGIASLRLAFSGRANHAGTTPMSARRDAGLGAAAFILAARQLVLENFPGCVANVGALRLESGAFNIIPGRAELALECRAVDPAELDRLQTSLLQRAQREAESFGLGLEVSALGQHAPAPMSQLAQQAIHEAAADLGLSTQTMPSGAGHDAQNLAPLCPSGMVFIPSVDGISHSPSETSRWGDCINGANVLLGAAMRLAGISDPG
jgi:N-carbamoyl-L-amino-acid hydrolase